MPGGPCDPVAGTGQHDAEPAVTRVMHRFAESGALGFYASDPVGVLPHHFEAALRGQSAGRRTEGILRAPTAAGDMIAV